MSWKAKLPKAPDLGFEKWETPERIWQEWTAWAGNRGAKNTRRNLMTYPKVFCESFAEPATKLNEDDCAAFVAKMQTKCSKLMMSDPPECLLRHDVSRCPVLSGTQPFTACPSYEPLQPSGVLSYITTTNRLYSWLIQKQQIGINPMLPVMQDFLARYGEWFDDRRNHPHKRKLTLDEVRRLVIGSHIQHGIGVALMAKDFLREHELLKLSIDDDHFSLREGWFEIPVFWDLGGKRKFLKRILIDSELKRFLNRYLDWRTDRLKIRTDRLMITQFGLPWAPATAVGNFNHAIQANAIELKLMTGTERKRKERVNSHCLRTFATAWADDHGADPRDQQVLRGDLPPGALAHYHDYVKRLPELYRKYSPVLGLP